MREFWKVSIYHLQYWFLKQGFLRYEFDRLPNYPLFEMTVIQNDRYSIWPLIMVHYPKWPSFKMTVDQDDRWPKWPKFKMTVHLTPERPIIFNFEWRPFLSFPIKMAVSLWIRCRMVILVMFSNNRGKYGPIWPLHGHFGFKLTVILAIQLSFLCKKRSFCYYAIFLQYLWLRY